MALTGDQLDLYRRTYSDVVRHELQQNTSVLEAAVTREEGMGERRYFTIYGAADDAELLTQRFEPLTFNGFTAERRIVTPSTVFMRKHLAEIDEIRSVVNPQSPLMDSILRGMRRQLDDLIIAAIMGTALREVSGSASNVTFDTSNQQIADTYVGLSDVSAGSVGLHEGKIERAMQILKQNFVDVGGEEVFVIGNANQFAQLRARLALKGYARKDFMNKEPLMIPGVDVSLDGFAGCRFLHSERIPQISSGIDNVIVMPKSAVTLGVWKDINSRVDIRTDVAGMPVQLYSDMSVGAVRMYEKKVVSIKCAA